MLYDHVANSFRPERFAQLMKQAPSDATSRADLAQLLGVSHETIDEIASGQYEPTLHMAYKLAAAFEVPIEMLFADETQIKFVKRS